MVNIKQKCMLLSNSENREQLKNFRKVYCVVTSHNKVQDTPANHKLITVAVCGLVFSLFIGFLLAKQ